MIPQADPDFQRYAYYISNSEVQAWKRCRRKWWLGWYRKLERRTRDFTGAMPTGTRIHAALAQWYVPDRPENLDLRAAINDVIDQDRANLEQDIKETHLPDEYADALRDKFTKGVTLERIMIAGYQGWLADTGVDADLQVISSETPVSSYLDTIALGMPYSDDTALVDIYAIGILDAIVRRITDGAEMFIDHKTVQSLTAPLALLFMNEQMQHYRLIQFTDEAITTTNEVLYNMLRKVKRTASANPPFFARETVRFSRHELTSFTIRLLGTVRDLAHTVRMLNDGGYHNAIAYPSPRDSCAWDCPFISVCHMFDDNSRVEDALSAMYRTHDPLDRYFGHPEYRVYRTRKS